MDIKTVRNNQQPKFAIDDDGDDFRGQTDCDVSNRHLMTSELDQRPLSQQKRRYADDRLKQTSRGKSRPSFAFDLSDFNGFDDLRGKR